MPSTTSSSAAAATKLWIEKISARVFCRNDGTGGNPVSIFVASQSWGANGAFGRKRIEPLGSGMVGTTVDSSPSSSPPHPLPTKLFQRLARTCAWESVMVDATSHQLQGFYMPTGEPVRFCVHAALGGIYALATAKQNVASAGPTTGVPPPESIRHGMASTTPATPKENRFTVFDTSTNTNYPYTIDRAGGGSVMLHLTDMPWTESVVTDKPSLFRLLRTTHAVFAKSLFKDDRKNLFPTFCHVTLWERPKTLVCMKDIDELQKAIPPSTQDADDYRLACDALDETTGLYLYAARDNEPEDQDPDDYALDTDPAVILAKQKRKAESSIPAGRSSSSSSSPDLANQPIVVSWECRQFPRFSGYPEDPATGVAAGALAVSLEHRYMEAVVKPRRNYFQKQRELLERYKAAGEIPIETTTGSAESRRWKKSERMVEFTEEMYEESRKFLEDGIRDVERPRCYKMYQGTAMGKSSVIVLDQIVWNQTQTQPQTHDKPSSTVDEVKNALDESKRQQSNHGGGDDDDEDVSEFVGKLSQGSAAEEGEEEGEDEEEDDDDDDDEPPAPILHRSSIVSFRLSGRVAIDHSEMIEIDANHENDT